MSKFEKGIINLIIALFIVVLTAQAVMCDNKNNRDKINYKYATFVYNEEIITYRELVEALDDYQLEKYNDTNLIGESQRDRIDSLETALDSIYAVNTIK